MDNDALIEEFLSDVELRGWSNWTIKSCKYSVNLFNRNIEEKPFREVGKNELKNFFIFLKSRKGRNGKLSHETLRKHINNLSSFFEFLEDEEYITKSQVPNFRRRYVRSAYGDANKGQIRQIIDLSQMRNLLGSILDPHDQAMFVLMAKTGLRVQELVSIDVSDISIEDLTINIKPTGKRKHMIVYFDYETKGILVRWLKLRKEIVSRDEKAMFVTGWGTRISVAILNKRLKRYAELLGIHDPHTMNLEKRFTSHCFRHFFTTELINSGMKRDFVKELRGDSRSETIDIYTHITPEELRREYILHIPKFYL